MADMDKDKEQDKRLNYIDAELMDIKSVTHGSELHGWNGVIAEQRSLKDTVDLLKENSDFITRFLKTTLNIFKALSIIGGLFLTGFSIYHLMT
jgi:hypothetical protein